MVYQKAILKAQFSLQKVFVFTSLSEASSLFPIPLNFIAHWAKFAESLVLVPGAVMAEGPFGGFEKRQTRKRRGVSCFGGGGSKNERTPPSPYRRPGAESVSANISAEPNIA
jgi:hypothetical protein